MPVYEYECGACGHRFEEWQKITDKAVQTCPECKADKVERLISQTAFHLKGGGWYSDLYSTKKSGSSSEGGGGDKGGGDKGGGDKGGGDKGGGGEKAGSTPKATESKPAETPKKKDGGSSKADAA
jgi:putative FmdB family regulatory protein